MKLFRIPDTPRKRRIGLVLAVIFTAFCLRAPFTGLGAIAGIITNDLGINSGTMGALTTIPLVAFALLSMTAGEIGSKRGIPKVLIAASVVLSVGILLRSIAGVPGLFIGTALIGVGIAFGNVLVPAIIKEKFPNNIGIMTGTFTTVMTLMSGLSSGVGMAIAVRAGWKPALLVWIIPALAAVITWILEEYSKDYDELGSADDGAEGADASAGAAADPRGERTRTKVLLSRPSTWWIALFMGVQSLIFYCMVAWVSTIMQSKGFSLSEATFLNTMYMWLGIPGSFILPIIAGRRKSQTGLAAIMGIPNLISILVILFSDSLPVVAVALMATGLFQGGYFSLAMALFGLKSSNGREASMLSGFSQSLGYLLAAIGPTLLGATFDLSGSWTIALVLLALFSALMTIFACLAGRDISK